MLKGAKKPLILLGKGAAYAQADADIRAFVENSGIPYLPMSMAKGLLPDNHAQSASAARSYVLAEADVVVLIGARLNWLLSHGKGKTWGAMPKKFIQIDISPTEIDSNVAIEAPLIGDIGSCVPHCSRASTTNGHTKPDAAWTGAIAERKDKNMTKMAETLDAESVADEFPQRPARDPRHPQDPSGHQRRQRRRQHARLRPFDHRHVRAAQALRLRHLGHHGHRHGLRHRRGRR